MRIGSGVRSALRFTRNITVDVRRGHWEIARAVCCATAGLVVRGAWGGVAEVCPDRLVGDEVRPLGRHCGLHIR